MNEKIRNFIFLETYNIYNHNCYSNEDLKSLRDEAEAEIELALDCYYRFDDEERDRDIIRRAWDMYDIVRLYNRQVISALNTILREREVINNEET